MGGTPPGGPPQPTPFQNGVVPGAGARAGAMPDMGTSSLSPDDKILEVLLERGKLGPGERHEQPSLSRPEEDTLVRHIIRDFEDTVGSLTPFRRNMVEMTKNWRGTPDPKDFPFKDSANLMQPLTSVHVEGMKARIKKALFGGDIITRIERMDATLSRQQMDEQNQWFQWELDQIVQLEQEFDQCLHELLVHGLSIPVPTYCHRERYLRSVRRYQFQPGQALQQTLDQLANTILQDQVGWQADLDDGPTQITGTPNIGEYSLSDGGSITFSIVPSGPANTPDGTAGALEIVADVYSREVVFDGAKIECIRLEDLVVSPSANKIEDLPFFGWRYWASVSDYRDNLENGYYRDLGKAENLRIINQANTKTSNYIPQEETTTIDTEEGVDSRDTMAVEPTRKWIEVYHWEGWWVWDKTGRAYDNKKALEPAVQIAVEVQPNAQRCIRINRLEDLNKDGKRSGIKFSFLEEPGRFFPIGLAGWIRHSQAELNAVHNQRVDAGLLNNVPFGFYDPATGLKKEVLQIEPGKFYPVRNPQAVNMPRSNWQPAVSFQEEMLIKRYAGEQSGITDQALGQPVSKRQSASEFVGTVGATDLRTEQFVKRLLLSLRELLYRILGLYQQFGPPRRIFRVAGSDGVALTKLFERDRLQGRLLLTLTGNVQQINEQLQRQVAVDMLQLLLNEALIKLGIVKPDTIYGAISLVAKLMHYGEVPLHRPDYPPESDAPNIEHKQMSMGLPVKGPTISENFNEHLQAHAMMASNPQTLQLMGQAGMQALQQHILKTTQMQQQVMLMRQMQAAQAAQMAIGMEEKGIRPGKQGGQGPGDNAGPGTQEEGVQESPMEDTGATA